MVNGGMNTLWERIAIATLSVMVSGIGIWLWDMRGELTQVRRAIDQTEWAIKYVAGMQGQVEQRAERMGRLENKIEFVNDRLGTMTARILSVAQRQDRCKCPTVDGEGGTLELQLFKEITDESSTICIKSDYGNLYPGSIIGYCKER